MKKILQSSKVTAILVIVGGVIILLIVFALGAAVGYHRALFASGFGQNYYRNFYGDPAGRMSFSMHGVAGEIIDLSSSSISVKDPQGNEQSVTLLPSTLIREQDDTVTVDQLVVGEGITVIGEPNTGGQIEAKFIRVFPASSSMPLPPPLPTN